MKKIVSTVAALGLIAGVASTASAVEVKLSGKYKVDGYYMSNGEGDGIQLSHLKRNPTNPAETLDAASDDSFYMHHFNIKPTIKVNNKVTMKADVRLAYEQVWGSQDDLATTDGGNVEVHKLFMEYKSPIGKWRIGRTLAGPYTLNFLNTEKHANRIMFWPAIMPKNHSLLFFLQKGFEGDGLTAGGPEGINDADNDYYEARYTYKSAALKIGGAIGWFDNAKPGNAARFDNTTGLFDTLATDKFDKNRAKGFIDGKFGSFYFLTEACYEWGTREYEKSGVNDEDLSTFAAMADLGIKTGKIDVGAMLIYSTGDDDPTDDDLESSPIHGQGGSGLGENFQPYYILTGPTTNIYNPKIFNNFQANFDTGAIDFAPLAGITALGAHIDAQVSPKLSLHAAAVYALANAEMDYWDDELGIEVDFGVAYKLTDNLVYEAHFGYLMTGDFFEGPSFLAPADELETEDVILASHHLTMTF